MENYKEMYLRLFRATEEAISCLVEAQRECEEMYCMRTKIKPLRYFIQ